MLQVNNFYRASMLLGLSLAMQLAYGQNTADSITVTTTHETGEETPHYHYFSAEDFEQRTIFKLANDAISSTFTQEGINGISISCEQKISRSISGELGWANPIANKQVLFFNLRYYYNKGKKRNVDPQKTINNFTGNYFLIGAVRTIKTDSRYEFTGSYNPLLEERNVYSLLYGHQQKIGKWGFFDIGGGINYFASSEQLQLAINLKMGLAYGKFSKAKTNGADLKYDEFKNNYEDRRGIFKWSNPYLILNSSHEWGVGSTFAYERKLSGRFSLIARARLGATHQEVGFNFSGDPNITLDVLDVKGGVLDIEGRYYYNRQKRLLSGLPVRSFSGNYISFIIEDAFAFYHIMRNGQSGILSGFQSDTGTIDPNFGLTWGTQQRLGGKGFFDLNLGMKYDMRSASFYPAATVRVGLLLGNGR